MSQALFEGELDSNEEDKRFLLSWSPHYSFGDTQMNSGKDSAEK